MTLVETIPSSEPRYTHHVSAVLADARNHLNACEPPPRVHAALQRSLNLPRAALAPARNGLVQAVSQWWVVRQRWSAAAVALLAVLVVASVLEIPWGVAPIAADVADSYDGFVPVGNTSALSTGSTAWLVRTEMSRQQLATLGLPFDPSRAAERVPAEVLLRPNGELLAVRLVR